MNSLSPVLRRELVVRAHALHPVVAIGQHGLTDAVLREVDAALRAHELVKVRIHGEDRAARSEALVRMCAALDAAAVQKIGKVLVLWRPAPPEAASENVVPAKSSTTKRERTVTAKKTLAAKKPAAKPAGTRRGAAPPRAHAAAGAAGSVQPGARSRRRRGTG